MSALTLIISFLLSTSRTVPSPWKALNKYEWIQLLNEWIEWINQKPRQLPMVLPPSTPQKESQPFGRGGWKPVTLGRTYGHSSPWRRGRNEEQLTDGPAFFSFEVPELKMQGLKWWGWCEHRRGRWRSAQRSPTSPCLERDGNRIKSLFCPRTSHVTSGKPHKPSTPWLPSSSQANEAFWRAMFWGLRGCLWKGFALGLACWHKWNSSCYYRGQIYLNPPQI